MSWVVINDRFCFSVLVQRPKSRFIGTWQCRSTMWLPLSNTMRVAWEHRYRREWISVVFPERVCLPTQRTICGLTPPKPFSKEPSHNFWVWNVNDLNILMFKFLLFTKSKQVYYEIALLFIVYVKSVLKHFRLPIDLSQLKSICNKVGFINSKKQVPLNY